MATPTNLPAAFSVGDVLTSANMNLLRGAFRILQVVTAGYDTIVTNNTGSFVDTGLTATITPQSTTSKILVIVSQTFSKSAGNAANAVKSNIVRGATSIFAPQNAALYTGTAVDLVGPSMAAIVLDSPATVSATTYKTQFANFTNAAGVGANTNNGGATIILMEVSA
jgi:hypothetical protein